MKSEDYLERGDGPAKAVLRANAEQQALRQAIETQEELQKIRDRVCITLSAYEIGEELRVESQNNVEEIKNAFVKDDAELAFVDDMTKLYLILSDPIAKRKYQQKVTIFVVGYENLCSHRNKLLLQLEEFFNQSTEDSSFVVDIPDFDFDEMEKNVSEALSKAEKATERLGNISKEVLKVFGLVNPKDHKKGKKKLEKALFQSHQDVMNLTEKLVGVQSDFEDAKTKLNALNKQVELKEVEVERLKLQVNTNKAFERESDDLRKALEAKEQQLQSYRVQMDESELSLSQAENKYDNYVDRYKNLKGENEKLTQEMEKRSKEQQQKIIETRKDLELKYDWQVNELKENQEELIVKLKQSHDEEVKNLREKIDLMRKSSGSKSETVVSSAVTTPLSRDSALHDRFSSSMMMSEHSQTLTMRSSAKIVKTLTDLKSSVSSRLDTASSQVSMRKEKDSVLDASSILFVSMTNTPTPSTPKTTETQRTSFAPGSRGISTGRKTREISSQTEDNSELIDDERQVKSRNDMQEIEMQLCKTPSHELPHKMEEYKNKFMEIERELQEEVLQWKLKFNSKSQALNQLFLTNEEDMKEKEHIMEELFAAQERQTQAEKETEQAILQLEELRAAKEDNLDEDSVSSDRIATENKSTATSASLLRRPPEQNQVTMADRLQSSGDVFLQQSVAIQCPSAHASRKPSMESPQYSDLADEDDGVSGIPQSDSGFGGSGHVLLSKSPDENYETNKDVVSQNIEEQVKEGLMKPQVPVPAASPRVRSRLVRSALKDHLVVSETIKTFEMITEFKMNITFWLQQHGLENKSDLLATLPEITLDKSDELDVLSKMPLIRDHTRQVLDALWQVRKEDCPWPEHGGSLVENGDNDGVVNDDDISSRLDHFPPMKEEQEMYGGKLMVEIGTSAVEKVPAGSVETDRQSSRSLRRTTPKGYTHLLHEYNNLNEEYNKLQEQLRESLKSYQQQTGQNAAVMNEMQETINDLRWQLLEGSSTGRNTRQALISSVMFTRLDAERNVKTMKRAVQSKRLSQDSFNDAMKQMNQYVDLPGRRFVELVKRYRHHCIMKEIEENLHPPRMTSDAVYNLQEKMEHLQRIRAQKWSEKMAEMSQQRSTLSEGITSCLNEIEGDSGIFLIKPVYSYSSRLHEVEKPSHRIICKKRIEMLKKSSVTPTEGSKKPVYSMETSRSVNVKQANDRPMWNSKESHVSGIMSSFDNDPIPRLLAMDVNRIMLNRNPVSEFINTKSGDGLSLSGVRQYVTVERPIGITSSAQHHSNIVSPRHSLRRASRSPSPSLSLYSTLPPINLPKQPRSSTTSAYTNQSVSSLSMTSFDDTYAR